MSIRFDCPECKKEIRVEDPWAGKRGKCPFCRAVLKIPTEGKKSPTKKPAADKPEILQTPKGERLIFACPKCAVAIRVDAKYAGRRMPCPHCKETIHFPDPRANVSREDDTKDGPLSEEETGIVSVPEKSENESAAVPEAEAVAISEDDDAGEIVFEADPVSDEEEEKNEAAEPEEKPAARVDVSATTDAATAPEKEADVDGSTEDIVSPAPAEKKVEEEKPGEELSYREKRRRQAEILLERAKKDAGIKVTGEELKSAPEKKAPAAAPKKPMLPDVASVLGEKKVAPPKKDQLKVFVPGEKESDGPRISGHKLWAENESSRERLMPILKGIGLGIVLLVAAVLIYGYIAYRSPTYSTEEAGEIQKIVYEAERDRDAGRDKEAQAKYEKVYTRLHGKSFGEDENGQTLHKCLNIVARRLKKDESATENEK